MYPAPTLHRGRLSTNVNIPSTSCPTTTMNRNGVESRYHEFNTACFECDYSRDLLNRHKYIIMLCLSDEENDVLFTTAKCTTFITVIVT